MSSYPPFWWVLAGGVTPSSSVAAMIIVPVHQLERAATLSQRARQCPVPGASTSKCCRGKERDDGWTLEHVTEASWAAPEQLQRARSSKSLHPSGCD